LIMIGVAVAGLLFVFFARRLISSQVAIPVKPVEFGSRPAEAALGLKRDLEPPGIEEAPELTEPQLQDTLSIVASAVASRTALLSDEEIDSESEPGRGKGLGDNRSVGLGGEGATGARTPQRQIRFEPETLGQYARWLDFFKIELGVLGRDNLVHYAYNLSQPRPDVRTGAPSEEQRLYMNSGGTPLAMLDQRLARKAGIADRGRILLQFYPPPAQAILQDLERKQAGSRSVDQVLLTVYRVTPKGDSFEFSVEEQQYR
jgi:hypothetical protein